MLSLAFTAKKGGSVLDNYRVRGGCIGWSTKGEKKKEGREGSKEEKGRNEEEEEENAASE